MKIPELLAPAGNMEKLKTALLYGADAVYLGGGHSLRARAGSFTGEKLTSAVRLAHGMGKKAYVTVNVFAHNRDLDAIARHLEELAAAGVDGIIAADPGVIRLARSYAPRVLLHLSTQANVSNRESALFYEDLGVKRINLARELSLAEIAEVRQALTCEIEVFVHGALCISYSGRCLLSAAMTGRQANLGDCAHPCRYRYRLVEEKRPGEYFPIDEDDRGTYIMNSRDLCLIDRLPELAEIGVDSVKIEGRMKSAYYVGAVVRGYREGLDRIAAGRDGFTDIRAELDLVGTRGYTENFFNNPPGPADLLPESPRAQARSEPVGIVSKTNGTCEIEVRNPIERGDEIEYIGPGFVKSRHRISGIIIGGEAAERANPGLPAGLELSPPPADWPAGALLRRIIA